MMQSSRRRRHQGLSLLVAALSLLSVGCGGTETVTFPVTLLTNRCETTCPTGSIFTVSIVREVNETDCVYRTSSTEARSLTLEELPLSEGEAVTVVVDMACKSEPGCAMCSGDLDIKAGQGGGVELTEATGCKGIAADLQTCPLGL